MSGNVALDKKNAFFGVDSAGESKSIGFKGAFAKFRRILADGYGVHIYDGIDAVIIFLKSFPVFDSSEIVTEGENTGGLNSAENAFFSFRCGIQSRSGYYRANRSDSSYRYAGRASARVDFAKLNMLNI